MGDLLNIEKSAIFLQNTIFGLSVGQVTVVRKTYVRLESLIIINICFEQRKGIIS